jgi:import receptor subunit TOM20
LEGKGSHCSQCLRQIDEGAAIKPDDDRLSSAFCSKECEANLKAESQSLLFGPEYAIPIELNPNQGSESDKTREDAQTAFTSFVRESGSNQVMLVARFIARQVVNETVKLLPANHHHHPSSSSPESAPPSAAQQQTKAARQDSDSDDELTENGYTLFDHVERVRFLELTGREGEAEQLRAILKANLQGLEDFVTDERYTVLVGKMAYNAYGISPAGGRDDKVRFSFFSSAFAYSTSHSLRIGW